MSIVASASRSDDAIKTYADTSISVRFFSLIFAYLFMMGTILNYCLDFGVHYSSLRLRILRTLFAFYR